VTTWGVIFNRRVRAGDDHGYAAHLADKYEEKKMTNEMSTNEQIATWLGYRRHSVFINNWFLPDAPEDTHDKYTIPTPDFTADPAHFERIKARLRELDIYYEFNCRPRLEQSRHRLFVASRDDRLGEYYGASEGEVLVQCALALIGAES